MINMVFTGLMQYATVQEALGAAQWLDTWMTINYSSIIGDYSAYSVTALIPPVTDTGTDPPANGQLSWTIHLTGADTASIQDLGNTALGPLSDGTAFLAVQNSTGGCVLE